MVALSIWQLVWQPYHLLWLWRSSHIDGAGEPIYPFTPPPTLIAGDTERTGAWLSKHLKKCDNTMR